MLMRMLDQAINRRGNALRNLCLEKENQEKSQTTLWKKNPGGTKIFYNMSNIHVNQNLSPRAHCTTALLKCHPLPSHVHWPKELVAMIEKLQLAAPSRYLK